MTARLSEKIRRDGVKETAVHLPKNRSDAMFGCVGEGRRRESLSSTLTNSSPSDQQRPLLTEMQNSDDGDGTNASTYAELRLRERESTCEKSGYLSLRRHLQVERSHESDILETAAVDHTEANPPIQPSTSLFTTQNAHPDGSCSPDENIEEGNTPEIESPPAHVVIFLSTVM